MQVDALVRSSRRATSREAIELLTFADLPFGRLEVSAILKGVVPHARDHYQSPRRARRVSSNDAGQRAPMRARKP